VRLLYFGNDNPYRFFRYSELEQIPPPWSDRQAHGTLFTPEPGYYAVSATLLPGHFFSLKYRNYFQTFRNAQPLARVGYSIYLYRF
jgi:hypothetical protein